MSTTRRGLGRGLDALLGESGNGTPQAQLRELPVDLLERGRFQPRTEFDPDALAELADSIRAQGVVQPIVARPLPGGRYEIVAGERRWRAAQLAGLGEVPALVQEISDETAVAVALIENIQREDLNALEEASALHRLTGEFGMTHQEVADAVGRSRAAVSNLLRLLELAPEVKELVNARALEMGHARALRALEVHRQGAAAQQVVARKLTVRETEKMVRRWLDGSEHRPAPRRLDPDLQRLEERLCERLGATVHIRQDPQGRGSGRLEIRYTSLDQLDGILERLG